VGRLARILVLSAVLGTVVAAWSGIAAAASIPGFPAGQCTEWGYLKRPDIVDNGIAKNGISGNWNADHWAVNALAAGYQVGSTPAYGAIAVWPGGVDGAGVLGHVAFVEQVNADGSFRVSEENWNNSPALHYRVVQPDAAISFIYLLPGQKPRPGIPKPAGALLSLRVGGVFRASDPSTTFVDVILTGSARVRFHLTGAGVDKTIILPLRSGRNRLALAQIASTSVLPAGPYRLEAYALMGGMRLFWSTFTLAG
jgi:surface antigen